MKQNNRNERARVQRNGHGKPDKAGGNPGGQNLAILGQLPYNVGNSGGYEV